jgi:polyribonucleotide nucleotidyltransferase
MTRHRRDIAIGNTHLSLESGRLARQADGAVVASQGDSMVLTTACVATGGQPRDFLPLTVDYREYASAGGRIPGGFFKREGRPTEKEIITSRVIDRPLRPLFPDGYTQETQIISMVLSADGEHDPDILAINSASAALVLSRIPFYNPVGAVRVALIDGEQVFNPSNSQRDVADLDLVVVATEEAVVMVEAAANQLSEEVLLDCIFAAQREAQKSILAQHQLFREMALEKPDWQAPAPYPPDLYERVRAAIAEPLWEALHTKAKHQRKAKVDAVVSEFLATLPEGDDLVRVQTKRAVEAIEDESLRRAVLENSRRFDGRELDEIRAIDIEVGLLPRTHGSALFTRGETQALASVTLGTRRDAQLIESYEDESFQKFMLHYNFPPFSVGEVRFLRGPSRRDIGHGVLARRALMAVLPHEDEFPYTVRVVSDILESNGSSSMATICGASLALFDAGVPLLSPVAGVAMGLIKTDQRFAVLTDIAGQEDHYGDMDFKVAGTEGGITALQMDIKIKGVSRDIMGKALEQARAARLHILNQMQSVIDRPRGDISQHAPRLHTLQVPPDKIRDVIGPGGKTIRSIQEETGCEIEIENDGKVIVASPSQAAAKRAIELIEGLTEVPEVGRVYTGKVQRIEPYGAFVEILPGTDGLVHISELAPYRVGEVRDILTEGDEISVKVIDIEPPNKVRLSRKAVIMEAPDYDPAAYEGMGAPPGEGRDRDGGGDRGGDRGDRRGGRPPGGRGGRGGRGGGGRDRR